MAKNRVYSFDVFDTCLARLCGEPRLLFDVLSLKVQKAMGEDCNEHLRELFSRHSMRELCKLDIWDKDFLQAYGLEDARRRLDKRIHSYLKKTASKYDDKTIRFWTKC